MCQSLLVLCSAARQRHQRELDTGQRGDHEHHKGQGDVLPSSQGGTEMEVEEVGGRGEQRSRRTDVKEVLVAEVEESGSYHG